MQELAEWRERHRNAPLIRLYLGRDLDLTSKGNSVAQCLLVQAKQKVIIKPLTDQDTEINAVKAGEVFGIYPQASPGMKARLRLAPDTASRNIESPQELLRMLRQSKRLQKYYESLNPSMRRYIAKWVGEGKHSETRERRAEQLAERLMQTMEAERELPPVLQAALVHNPKARAGWELMPPSHRRNHLLSIFYYRNPESRARRVAKAVEMMLEYAEKRRNRAKPRNSQ